MIDRLRVLGLVSLVALAPTARADGDKVATGKVTGKVAVSRDGKLMAPFPAHVYVYVLDDEVADGTVLPDVKITQKNFKFAPALQVVPVGTRVYFPNKDKTRHSVFSQDPQYIDLGTDERKNKSFVFAFEGEIDIYCNIHPDMAAKVKVMPSLRFVEVAADGTYALDVPLGKHALAVWMPDSVDVEQTVTVVAETRDVNFKLRQGHARTTHLNKDGKPYDRYDK